MECHHSLIVRQLVVAGDVLFGRNVVIKGTAHISTRDGCQHTIPDGALIEGTVLLG